MMFCFIGGWLNSYIYRKYLRKRNKGYLFWCAVIFLGALFTLDMLIYMNFIDVHLLLWPWIKIPKGVNPGRYWMFNPFLMFGIQLKSAIIPDNGLVWDLFALFFFVSYIWWFTIGQNLGRFMYGRLTYERGAWYLARSTNMIKKSKEKLERKLEKK